MFVKYFETDLIWLDNVYHIAEWAKVFQNLAFWQIIQVSALFKELNPSIQINIKKQPDEEIHRACGIVLLQRIIN